MPEVFANTTPLQYLHRLGRLDWLREFYGRIVVPAAVADELEAGLRLGAQVPELAEFPWIEIRRVPGPMPAFPGSSTEARRKCWCWHRLRRLHW